MYVKHEDAGTKMCPFNHKTQVDWCLGKGCMGWREVLFAKRLLPMPAELRDELAKWLRANPMPGMLRHAHGFDADYAVARDKWLAAGLLFIESLAPTQPPPEGEWVWEAGVTPAVLDTLSNNGSGFFYAGWMQPAHTAGYCGRIGKPDGEVQ